MSVGGIGSPVHRTVFVELDSHKPDESIDSIETTEVDSEGSIAKTTQAATPVLEEELITLVDKRDWEGLTQLFNDHPEDAVTYRGKAVVYATKLGRCDLVPFLLEGDAEILPKHRAWAALVVARWGPLDTLWVLLSDRRGMSLKERGDILGAAAKGGDGEVLQQLLRDPYFKEASGEAVIYLVDDVKSLKLFLEKGGELLPKAKGKAVEDAVRGNHLDVLEFLLANDVELSPEDRGSAVVAAAYSNLLEPVELLLRNGAAIPLGHQVPALHFARTSGNKSMEQLLQDVPVVSMSKEPIKAKTEPHQGRPESAIQPQKATLTQAGPSASCFSEKQLITLVLNRDQEGLKRLFSDHPVATMPVDKTGVSPKDRGQAVIMAIDSRHWDIVHILLADQSEIFPSDRKEILESVTKKGYAEELKELLKDERFKKVSGEVIISFAVMNRLDSLRLFLASGAELSSQTKGRAVATAAGNHSLDVLRFLLGNDVKLSPEDRGMAIEEASQEHDIEALRLLLADGKGILPSNKQQALELVRMQGNPEIERLLQNPPVASVLKTSIPETESPQRSKEPVPIDTTPLVDKLPSTDSWAERYHTATERQIEAFGTLSASEGRLEQAEAAIQANNAVMQNLNVQVQLVQAATDNNLDEVKHLLGQMEMSPEAYTEALWSTSSIWVAIRLACASSWGYLAIPKAVGTVLLMNCVRLIQSF